MTSFQSYWNANHTNIQRDAAHLFTGKSYALSSGYALIGVICNPNNAYGLSGYVDWSPAKFLITAHEIGHNLGGNHVEEAQSCGNTLMNSQLSFNTPMSFCSFSRSEITNFVEQTGNVCLTAFSKSPFDFDSDGKTDISIFRPAPGEWWINRSSNGGNTAFQFGNSADKLVPADFTGDGKTDVAVFRPSNGNWFVLRSEDNSFYSFPFGTLGDIPVAADFDGDAKADAGVFRPSNQTWFINKSAGGTLIQQFGIAGDVPVAADFDGDARADIAIYRPALGEWWIQRSSAGLIAFQFGTSTDKPVQGDYTGDGKADVALFRPSNGNWYVLRSEDGSFYSAPFGTVGDVGAPFSTSDRRVACRVRSSVCNETARTPGSRIDSGGVLAAESYSPPLDVTSGGVDADALAVDFKVLFPTKGAGKLPGQAICEFLMTGVGRLRVVGCPD